jgi:hypothetical protein
MPGHQRCPAAVNAFSMFKHHFPELRRQTAHLTWPLKLQFWLAAFRLYVDAARAYRERAPLPKVGDPARRASCCDLRPGTYGRKHPVEGHAELRKLFRPRGTNGWNHYFQCSACGQEWLEVWHQDKFGGDHELRKAE